MSTSVISALVSLTISLVVSCVVVFLTRRSETLKPLQAIKMQAYVDFIHGVSVSSVISKNNYKTLDEWQRKRSEYRTLVADAKARIAIYGSRAVVTSLEIFWRGGTELNTLEQTKKFMVICQQMAMIIA